MDRTENQALDHAGAYELQAEGAAVEAVKTLFMRGRSFGFRVCCTTPLQEGEEGSKVSAAANMLLSVVTGAPSELDVSTLAPSTRLYQDAELLVANAASPSQSWNYRELTAEAERQILQQLSFLRNHDNKTAESWARAKAQCFYQADAVLQYWESLTKGKALNEDLTRLQHIAFVEIGQAHQQPTVDAAGPPASQPAN
ncbi:hypothetical protein [Achromobacter anxifer]|uniref:hypothetical protein n=1 Tax=Achromobacter anxifer TaxID=1287737 RepID=UPI0023F75A49|nr:hypothetical protein [Achromobacter anxifer]MDF8364696.1 hypothetical protein [Achromobacter anxifer]